METLIESSGFVSKEHVEKYVEFRSRFLHSYDTYSARIQKTVVNVFSSVPFQQTHAQLNSISNDICTKIRSQLNIDRYINMIPNELRREMESIAQTFSLENCTVASAQPTQPDDQKKEQ